MENPLKSSYNADLPFTFDSILKNMSEDELYNCFLNDPTSTSSSANSSNITPVSSPLNEPPVQFDTLEPNEFPDLSSLDLSEYLLQPIKQEPGIGLRESNGELKLSPALARNAIETEKRRIMLKDNKATKKPRTIKHEPVKIEQKPIKREEKYQKRLQANKRSAQASRERKKALKIELEQKVEELSEENSSLGTAITELETENKVLKNEFIHLQRLIGESSILSKLMAKANVNSSTSETTETQTNTSASTTDSTSTIVDPLSQALDSLAPPPMNTTAFMYLMIVMYTFSQHFSNVNPSSVPLKPLNLNGFVLSPPSISTVA